MAGSVIVMTERGPMLMRWDAVLRRFVRVEIHRPHVERDGEGLAERLHHVR